MRRCHVLTPELTMMFSPAAMLPSATASGRLELAVDCDQQPLHLLHNTLL